MIIPERTFEGFGTTLPTNPLVVAAEARARALKIQQAQALREKVLSNIEISNLDQKIFLINNKKIKFDVVVSTISPDFLHDYKYGELKFIGRDFHKIVFPSEYVFPKNVYFLYYANNEKFTRLVEYKKFTKHKSKTTLIGMEIPSLNGKHYPIPFKSEINRSHKYIKALPENFFSIGRAGTYRYEVDIDDCIEQAIEIRKILENNNFLSPFPIEKWWKM
jgi:UDP-galactopyranose mutase